MVSYRTPLLALIISVAFISQKAAAQQISSEPAQLALEVHFYPKEPPAYQTIPLSSPRGAWYARFGRVPGWVPPADSLPVTAVNIKSEIAEEGVRVWVSVFLGQIHEEEKKVASYVLREGQKTIVKDLSMFGVEPFELAVVRLGAQIGGIPEFISKARSIEVVSLRANFTTLPSYTVVVRNASTHNVHALRVTVLQGGRPRNMHMPQGKEGQPLILPGASYEFTTRVATKSTATPNGYTPTILPDQTIELTTAVFENGLFEGDSDAAIAFTAFQKGRKLQLANVVELFDKSLDSTAAESITAVSLQEKVSALSFQADAANVADLVAKFGSGLDQQRAKTLIEMGMKGMRDEVVKDIGQFQLRNRRRSPDTFHDWLASSKDRYQTWLARL